MCDGGVGGMDAKQCHCLFSLLKIYFLLSIMGRGGRHNENDAAVI